MLAGLSVLIITVAAVIAYLRRERSITERRRMEEELRESEEKFRGLVEGAAAPVALSDLLGRFTYVNKTLADLLGYPIQELSGHSFFDHIHPDDRGSVTSVFLSGLSSSTEAPLIEFRAVRKDGAIRCLMSKPTRLTIHGETVGFQAILTDITEQKRAQEELERYSKSLEELVAERTRELRKGEEKYRSLVENIPDVTWTTDRTGRTVFVSPNVAKVSGRTPEEIYAAGGTLWLERIHPDDIERVKEAYEALFAENKPYDVEYRIQRKDGEWVWFHDRSVAAYEKDGRQYADGLLSDITERKRIERQVEEGLLRLRQSEAKFRGLYDSVGDGILANDVSGRILECNRAFEDMVGYSLEELRKMTWQDITPKHYLEQEEGLINEQMLKRGLTTYLQKEYIRKDGSTLPVETIASMVRGTGGNPDMIWCIVRDMTERKQMEEALLRSQRMATIGELAAMVGHDLRNPLQGIANAVYYLSTEERPKLGEKGIEMLQEILGDIRRSDKIINDLLEYSREYYLELTETDVKSITKDALARLEIPAKIRVVDSTLDEPKMRLDTEKMRRVFLNLLQNAIDAMPDGGTVTIKSKRSIESVEIAFRDTGAGMTEDSMRRVWTPLYTTKAKGMGFGLAISKRIVEAHGGSMTVESKIGEGSTFTVILPVKTINSLP